MTQPMEPNMTWCPRDECPSCDQGRRLWNDWQVAQRQKRCPTKTAAPTEPTLTAGQVVLICLFVVLAAFAGVAYAVTH